jgi:hypothetical protein
MPLHYGGVGPAQTTDNKQLNWHGGVGPAQTTDNKQLVSIKTLFFTLKATIFGPK